MVARWIYLFKINGFLLLYWEPIQSSMACCDCLFICLFQFCFVFFLLPCSLIMRHVMQLCWSISCNSLDICLYPRDDLYRLYKGTIRFPTRNKSRGFHNGGGLAGWYLSKSKSCINSVCLQCVVLWLLSSKSFVWSIHCKKRINRVAIATNNAKIKVLGGNHAGWGKIWIWY